jgi:hypothetical protein
MGCLGVHFALTEEQEFAVWEAYEAHDDDGVLAAVETIEDASEKEHLQETDKAWDAIHRCLSDGTLSTWPGTWPLAGAVLGGECLYFRADHIVRLVDPEEVKEISAALDAVTRDWFHARFAGLREHGYSGTADEKDFDYTWLWFERLREFFRRTGEEGRAVLFCADQ